MPGSIAKVVCATITKGVRGAGHKRGSSRILRGLLFAVKQIFPSKIFDERATYQTSGPNLRKDK